MNSYAELVTLGSGALEIDALNLKCRFQGQEVEPLSIAYEVHHWLHEDLRQHHIEAVDLKEVTLTINIELSKSSSYSGQAGGFYIGKNGLPIEKGNFYKLAASCHSKVRTDEAAYEARRTHTEQWPVGWPET